MIVVTTEEVSGHRIVEMKGQVFGLVVRSRGLGGNIMAGLRSLGGGEITEYDSSEIGNTMSEIVAYGTAAVVEPVTS
jgi:uncharacterized protein YbjQ (UPF0145 family)